jgi:hypothetical protein
MPEHIETVIIPNRFDLSTREVKPVVFKPGAPLSHYVAPYVERGMVTILNGRVVEPAAAALIVPKVGDQIVVAQPIPADKGIWRTIGMIAVAVLAVVATVLLGPVLGTMAAALIGAAISIGGGLLVGWATSVKPASVSQSDSYGWQGPQMVVRQGDPIPKLYGKFGPAPKPISSYVTTTNNKQYLSILGCFGFGPARRITNIKINDNPIENYKGVTIEKRMGFSDQTPISFFSDVRNTKIVNQRVRIGSPVVVACPDDAEALEIEFYCPKGVWDGPDNDGSYRAWAIDYKVEYKPHTSDDSAYQTVLAPRTTADVGTDYWIAICSDQSMGDPNTIIVIDSDNGNPGDPADVLDQLHREGDPWVITRTQDVYDETGALIGTSSVQLAGLWTRNPNNSDALANGASAQGGALQTVADWTTQTGWIIGDGGTKNPTEAKRHVHRIDHLERGLYDVRVTKVATARRPGAELRTDGEDDTKHGEEMWISEIREIQYDDLSYPGMVLLGVRALATDQLSGSGLNITAEVEAAEPETLGYKHLIAADRPAAYWRFGEDSGTVLNDSSGHGRAGTYPDSGIAYGQPSLIKGSPQGCVEVSGNSIALATALAITGDWALDLWFEQDSPNACYLIGKPTDPVILSIGADKSISVIYGGETYAFATAFKLGEPNYIGLTCTGGVLTAIINGLKDANSFSGVPSPSFTALASWPGSPTRIDEVAVYADAVPRARLKMHYQCGISPHNAMEDYTMDNPACVAWDILTNPHYSAGKLQPNGRNTSIDLMTPHLAAWQEAADYFNETVPDGSDGLMYRSTFGGIYDQSTNVWDAVSKVCAMSRAAVLRLGTGYTIVVDKPSAPVQLFGMGNIDQGTFKESWLAIADRANSIDIRFANASNSYKDETLTVEDDAAIAAGAPVVKAPTLDLFGVCTPEQAWRQGMYQLLANSHLRRTVSFDISIEARACMVGDVVSVQHDQMLVGQSGRVKAIAGTALTLWDQVTLQPGKSYQVVVLVPTVQRGAGTISSIRGSALTVGLTDGIVGARLVQGSVDVAIVGATAGLITVDDASRLAPGPYTIWDTNVIDTRNVTTAVDTAAVTTKEITIESALSGDAADCAFALGEAESITAQMRVIGIARSVAGKVTLTLLDYKPEVYADLEPVLPEAITNANMIAVTDLAAREDFNNPTSASTIVVSWKPGKLTTGASIYAAIDGNPEQFLGRADTANSYQFRSMVGSTYVIRVVGFSASMKSAPYATAPTVTITAQGIEACPKNVKSFRVTAFTAPNGTLAWDANTDTDLDHYEIRYTWALAGATWDRSSAIATPAKTATSYDFTNGAGSYLIKAVDTDGNYSLFASVALTSNIQPDPNPDPDSDPDYGGGGCFSGNVEFKVPGGYLRFDACPSVVVIENETGIYEADLLVHDHDGPMIDFTGRGDLVTFDHAMRHGDGWIRASAKYATAPRVAFKGKVYNLHVRKAGFADQHFVLSNGDVAHNNKYSPP